MIDGDTLEVRGQRIRLHAIDAPESGQRCNDGAGESCRCGQRAALALADRIGDDTVACERKEIDRYGRVVAVCRLPSMNLNGWLVKRGLAVAYARYSRAYIGQEAVARRQRRGVSAGTFVTPWARWKGER